MRRWAKAIAQFKTLEELLIEVPRHYPVMPPTKAQERVEMRRWVERLTDNSPLRLIYIKRHTRVFPPSLPNPDYEGSECSSDDYRGYTNSESERLWEGVDINDRTSYYDHLWEKISGKWVCREVKWQYNEKEGYYEYSGSRGLLTPSDRYRTISDLLKPTIC